MGIYVCARIIAECTLCNAICVYICMCLYHSRVHSTRIISLKILYSKLLYIQYIFEDYSLSYCSLKDIYDAMDSN